MAAHDSFRKLTRTRVRLNRIRDGKILTGRLIRMSGRQAEIDIVDVESCVPGELFMVEVHGPIVKLVFPGRLDSRSGRQATMAVGNNVQYLPVSEQARISVDGHALVATWGDQSAKGSLVDVSKEGACLILPGAVELGTVLELAVVIRHQTYFVRGTVRYCAEMPNGQGQCRVGVKLCNDDRVSSAKWATLFEKILEAA